MTDSRKCDDDDDGSGVRCCWSERLAVFMACPFQFHFIYAARGLPLSSRTVAMGWVLPIRWRILGGNHGAVSKKSELVNWDD